MLIMRLLGQKMGIEVLVILKLALELLELLPFLLLCEFNQFIYLFKFLLWVCNKILRI